MLRITQIPAPNDQLMLASLTETRNRTAHLHLRWMAHRCRALFICHIRVFSSPSPPTRVLILHISYRGLNVASDDKPQLASNKDEEKKA